MTDQARENVLRHVADHNVKFIRLWFTDILGRVKSFAVTADELAGALERGMGFDGSSVTGYQDIEESDMVAMPDPTTFQILPWRPQEAPVGRMICDILDPGGQPYLGDPRHILKLALERARKMGFDHFYVGPELEYYYFRSDAATDVLDRGGYFDLTTLDVASDLRRDTILALQKMGIRVEYSHHEVGPSQHEIDMRYDNALPMADNVITYRVVVKEIANLSKVYATFMPKPIHGEAGSGMHVHQSLFVGSRNTFFSADDPYFLSDTAKKFVAGQLRHAPEMSSVFAQWVNSYKRLVPGYEAPVYVAWSQRNRSALIRVPHYHPGKEQATRVELRCPDPACNPYLTFALILHAGLDGIEKNYELQAPMDRNLYHLSPAERESLGILSLPDNLGEAVKLTAKSDLVRRALGDHIFNRYVELKRAEWEEYRIQVSPFEIRRYLPIL
jgi:glutamine synthetase